MTMLTIFCRDAATGEDFEAFHWTRDAESGIRRAWQDATLHNRPISHAWVGRTLTDATVAAGREDADKLPLLRQAFPDYPLSTLPSPMPADWLDRSWRNEPCPSFQIGEAQGLIVFIDYADADRREFPEMERFTVHGLDQFGQLGAGDTVLLATDDWDAVLAYVERHKRLERLTNGQMTREDAEAFLREEQAAERPCPDFLAELRHALEE